MSSRLLRGSGRAYARSRRARGLRGGTPRAIQVALSTGRIAQAVGRDGLIDFLRADELWEENTDPTKVPVSQDMAGTLISPTCGSQTGRKRDAPGGPEPDDLVRAVDALAVDEARELMLWRALSRAMARVAPTLVDKAADAISKLLDEALLKAHDEHETAFRGWVDQLPD